MEPWAFPEVQLFCGGLEKDDKQKLLTSMKLVEGFDTDNNVTLESILERRFDIIGGKIRHLLDETVSCQDLREKLRIQSLQLTWKDIISTEDIDVRGTFPSDLYHIVPSSMYIYPLLF
jgi:hypothetical protein